MIHRVLKLGLLVVALSLAACGDGTPAAPAPSAAPPPASQLTCPVEGTLLRPDAGVDVKVGERTVKVCSQGCAVRLQTTPERYLGKK